MQRTITHIGLALAMLLTLTGAPASADADLADQFTLVARGEATPTTIESVENHDGCFYLVTLEDGSRFTTTTGGRYVTQLRTLNDGSQEASAMFIPNDDDGHLPGIQRTNAQCGSALADQVALLFGSEVPANAVAADDQTLWRHDGTTYTLDVEHQPLIERAQALNNNQASTTDEMCGSATSSSYYINWCLTRELNIRRTSTYNWYTSDFHLTGRTKHYYEKMYELRARVHWENGSGRLRDWSPDSDVTLDSGCKTLRLGVKRDLVEASVSARYCPEKIKTLIKNLNHHEVKWVGWHSQTTRSTRQLDLVRTPNTKTSGIYADWRLRWAYEYY